MECANVNLQDRQLVVDLWNVIFISEEVLSHLLSKRAKFSTAGMLTRHLLQQLRRGIRRSASEMFPRVHPSVEEKRAQ